MGDLDKNIVDSVIFDITQLGMNTDKEIMNFMTNVPNEYNRVLYSY